MLQKILDPVQNEKLFFLTYKPFRYQCKTVTLSEEVSSGAAREENK